MQKFLFLILVICLYIGAYAQYYDSGQDPYSVQWKQIKTPTHCVIFSEKMEYKAKIYASYLSKIAKTGGISLNSTAQKIPVVIHSNTILSNGEVAWTPKRMNLYTVAPQNNANQPWQQHLLTHEYRHTAQISKLHQGFTKGLYYVFGEQAIGAVLGLHVPLWFLEGDAVLFETLTSEAGRGRSPNFIMKIKAQLSDKKIYSYPKAQFGSYKHFVPNHYELGYQLVAYNRQKYGAEIWSTALTKVGRYPIHINPFSMGIKRVSKLPERKLYKQTLNSLQQNIKIDSTIEYDKNCERITKLHKKDYINYYSPAIYENKIIALKTSYSSINKFVIIDKQGIEKHLHTPGMMTDKTLSVAKNLMVWNEYKTSRWQNKNFNNIVLYNLDTKKRKTISKKGRIFSSNISPDATKIVSVEVSKNIDWSITIRSVENGQLLKKFDFDTIQPMQPSWLPSQVDIVFTAVGNNGKSLGIINTKNKKIRWIIKNEQLDILQPKCFNNYLLVRAVYNNISNFFIYNITNNTWKPITQVKYGVGEGCVDDNNLIFSNYTADGFCLQKVPIDTLSTINIKPQKVKYALVDSLAKQEIKINFCDADTNFTVEKYSRFKHLINFHSWAPLAVNTSQSDVGLGVSAMSQNALSTSFLNIGAKSYLQQDANRLFVNYTYKGFYPILHLDYNYTLYSFYHDNIKSDNHLIKSNIHQLRMGVELPLKYSQSAWNIRFSPLLYYSFDATLFEKNNYYKNKHMHTVTYGLLAYNLQHMSYRDIYPKWGQQFYLKYQHSPFDVSGELFFARAKLYFPSLLSNHSLYFTASYQTQQDGVFNYMGNTTTARGYKLYKNDNINVFTANYSFPFLYPDLNIWELVYVKRLWINAFYDCANFTYKKNSYTHSSLGAELFVNFHLFRFVIPMQVGMQYALKLDANKNKNYFKFLFNIGLGSL